MSNSIKYFLGIDGGGTKTEFLLTDLERKEIKRLFLGNSNPVNRGIDNTFSVLDKGIREICKNISMEEISVFAGIAGSGTSGRLAVCDAAECPPTFGVPYDLFNGIIAGGEKCMFKAAENAEDNPEAGIADLKKRNFCNKDILIGISTSGSAAYVISAVNYAKSIGAKVFSITNNYGSLLGKTADIDICADTDPEVITGSTRMKAGTAQKIILNMISTASMVRCGYVYENLMINLKPTNKKLRKRMIGIVSEILGCSEEKSEKLLEENNWNIRSAVEIY